MARDFNQNRNTNAHLGTVDTPIKKPGTFYAQSYGFDGLSYVKVDFPDFVTDFIQGNNDTFEYFVPSNITSIRPYAFSGFPNLNDITILNEISEVTINENAFNGTKIGNKENGSKIWVVETYYDDYVSHYGSLYNFASFESETWYVINYEKVGTATLTKQLLNNLNIPLTFSGLVIASDINYVTSISVSELVSITQMWFKTLDNLIFDLDELPNGWVYENGTLYVSHNDYDTFIANHSGYENYISKEYSMTISGSGTLTSEIVENAIEDLALIEVPFCIITKVVVPAEFTSIQTGALNKINEVFESGLVLETNCNHTAAIMSNTSKLSKLIYGGSTMSSQDAFSDLSYTTFRNIDFVLSNMLTSSYRMLRYSRPNFVFAKELTTISGAVAFGVRNGCPLYFPKVTSIATAKAIHELYNSKVFFGKSDVSIVNNGLYNCYPYVGATYLLTYLSKSNTGNARPFVGIIDGNNVYTDKGFTYPKLTGIDTESNIQLLTPADNSIYLANDTGNLWQYSNSSWVNLFADYSATWYSDEDCITTVLPSAMDTTHTYYVKLTAI